MADPPLVFLDQNHWIYLARSYWGNPHKPSHDGVSGDLYEHVLRDEVRLPLNLLHLIEHTRNDVAERRARLAEVYERFSRSWFFAAWDDLIPKEIERAVFRAFAPQADLEPLEPIGRGYLFGVGPTAREGWPAHWTNSEIDLVKMITAQPEQLYKLLTFRNEVGRGRQKTHIKKLNDRTAEAAEDLRAVRRPYPADMHRRAQYARYTLALQESIETTLAKVGRSLDDFFALGVDGLTQFWRGVPSLDVDCELTVYRDRQWSRNVDSNDVADIGHLALAVPYCRAVVVEHFWAHALEQTGLADKYGVTVLTDIRDLALWLATEVDQRPSGG